MKSGGANDKEKFKQLDNLYSEKNEEKKNLKYNPDNIFKKESSQNDENSESNIILYKQTIFQKIKNKIKKLLKK